MYDPRDLLALVRTHFAWAEQGHGLESTVVESTSRGAKVRLRFKQVSLWLLFSADLPRLVYIEGLEDGGALWFDVWDFLCIQRRSQVEQCFVQARPDDSINERNKAMLAVLSCALRAAGQDILLGEDQWKRQYLSPERFGPAVACMYPS